MHDGSAFRPSGVFAISLTSPALNVPTMLPLVRSQSLREVAPLKEVELSIEFPDRAVRPSGAIAA